MKPGFLLLATIVFIGALAVLVPDVEAARPEVSCEFGWAENPGLNVKAGKLFRNKKVRTSEYNRLVSMGTVPVRVAADRGQRCQLNHPENTLIDTSLQKAAYRLDPAGRIPNCADLSATVTCRGIDR